MSMATLARSRAAHLAARSRVEFVGHAAVALLFAGLLISWPGAVLLSIIYLLAGCAAVVAGVNLHKVFAGEDARSWWLQGVGAAILLAGLTALALSGGALAIAPVAAGSWLAARAKDGWFFAPSVACLTCGLLLLSAFSEDGLGLGALFGVHAMSTGLLLVALAPRPVRPPNGVGRVT
jgi:hypothetical protein